ncbi:MAG: hypothetical protein EA393_08920 [Bacteroidetes bacterium]|nr:MAG: hypothetical protein EA393_08920 [Bacteroidota bacterium]
MRHFENLIFSFKSNKILIFFCFSKKFLLLRAQTNKNNMKRDPVKGLKSLHRGFFLLHIIKKANKHIPA